MTRGPRARSAWLVSTLWLGLALAPAAAAASMSGAPAPAAEELQEATRAAGGGQDTPETEPLPDSLVVPDSAVVTGARLDELTARVAGQLRCPVCRNQSVLESSSTLAREMQAEIKRRLAVGESPEEVESYFVSRYGEWILLKPEPRGINLLVYLLPALALLAGGLLVWHLLLKWTESEDRPEDEEAAPGPGAGSPPPAAAPSDETDLSAEEERRLESVLEGGTGTTS